MKKVIAWLKRYWYLALTFVAAGVSLILLGKKSENFLNALIDQREDDKERGIQLERIHDKQISERDSHIDEHAENLKKIDEESRARLAAIEENKLEIVSDLIAKDDLASELDKEFDF